MGKAKQRATPASVASRSGLTLGDRLKRKKINSKPKCLNEQEIPYRLREIMKSREEMKNPQSKKKKKAGNKQAPKIESDIPVPKFRQHKGESESSYVWRMEQETQRVLFLTENQLQREPEKEQPTQEKSQRKKKFQQKKLDKICKQKEEKKATKLEKEFFKDTVQFGEVALQPPTLTAKPRKSVLTDKAGRRQLLLRTLLGSGETLSTHKAVHTSLARRRIVQEERERVVEAYRTIKKRKQQQQQQQQLAMDKLRKPV
ncbi:coiled-coil domain-containing protein 137 [Tiliqua scincoides]|uniref:coiled-coil domain-containing protein 137 n=1 Tax=Tiliqua scincoides TaxID=71010 RepID=UPI0034629093